MKIETMQPVWSVDQPQAAGARTRRGSRLSHVAFCAISLTCGTASAGLFGPKSPYTLPDATLNGNLGNPDGLYQAWLVPLMKNDVLPTQSPQAAQGDEAALVDGFGKFCKKSGDQYVVAPIQYGQRLVCESPSHEFIASLQFTLNVSRNRLPGAVAPGRPAFEDQNWLAVTFESNATRRAAVDAQNAFQAALMKNGPSGWLQTTSGRQRFLRIGSLDQRQLVFIKNLPLESFKRVEFVDCCNFKAYPINGEMISGNAAAIGSRTAINTLTMGSDMTFVVLDPASKQPFVWLPGPSEVQAIELEQGAHAAQDGRITTQLTRAALVESRSAAYLVKLAKEAAPSKEGVRKFLTREFDSASTTNEERAKYFEDITEYVRKKLSDAMSASCSADPVKGLRDLDSPARCAEAQKELSLVTDVNHGLPLDRMPLSTVLLTQYVSARSEAGVVTLPK
jgi:hypothetical protein